MIRFAPRRGVLLAAAFAAALGAQSPVVVPPGTAGRDGNTLDWATARYLPCRAQCIYDRSLLVGLGNRTIRAIGVRAEYAPADTYPAHDVVTTLRMGSSDVLAPWAVNPDSYASNHPADWTTVLNAARIRYPQVSGAAPRPRAFASTMLSTPFPYRSGRHLILQWDCRSASGQPEIWLWYNDAERFQPGGGTDGRFVASGTTCPPGLVFRGRGGRPGTELSWWFYSQAGNGVPALGVIGSSRTTWAGTMLPFDLGGLGAPGCSIFCSQDAQLASATDPAGTLGRVRFDVYVPPDRSISNRTLWVQTLILDPRANSLGIRASALGEQRVGTPLSFAARLMATFSRPIDDVPQANWPDALVLEIH